MTTIGVLGAGQTGTTIARAAIARGHDVVIASTRDPRSLAGLVDDLGPRARAATAGDAAEAGDFAILAFRYTPADVLPVEQLSGKVVLDTNNYMPWRDGIYPEVASGRRTVHELRQRQLPRSMIAKAFTHIQHHARPEIRVPSDALPGLFRLARPAGAPDRRALVVSSDHPEAVDLVTRLYDELGFDTVDNSPLSESWRSAPGTPMWRHSTDGQTRDELIRRLAQAVRPSA
ncbi:NADPH-dependent F420 reductase [Microbacterium rhizophilus]|uniref:NADPH-dependent F420 reductase n=1 Tax=Microbacterium rhizophilus TaxID=3138934 RepID=UPI0031F0CCE2